MQTVYSNAYYDVVVNEKDEKTPYYVTNQQFGVVDYYSDNYPQALIVAEQFAALLTGDKFKHEVAEMYGSGFSTVGGTH